MPQQQLEPHNNKPTTTQQRQLKQHYNNDNNDTTRTNSQENNTKTTTTTTTKQNKNNNKTNRLQQHCAVSPLLACDHQGGSMGYQNSFSLIFLALVCLFCCKSGLISHQTFASVWMVLRLGYTRILIQNHRDTLIGK